MNQYRANTINLEYSSRRRMGLRVCMVTAAILILLSGFFIIHVYANNELPGDPQEQVKLGELAGQDYLVTDVVAGDTLWALANRYAPEGETVRSFMKKIRDINQLSGSLLREGQILYIPQ